MIILKKRHKYTSVKINQYNVKTIENVWWDTRTYDTRNINDNKIIILQIKIVQRLRFF